MNNEEMNLLHSDKKDKSALIGHDHEIIDHLMNEFIISYLKNKDKTVEDWLSEKIQEQVTDKTSEEINNIAREIIKAAKEEDEIKESLNNTIKNGKSKEDWLVSETKKAISYIGVHEASKYLNSLDDAIKSANDALHRTITTKAGDISKNRNLDGFIAEQYHAQTFNINAKAKESLYNAKALEQNGKRYNKNSVDIVITDNNNNIVKRYQSKYCKDDKAIEQAFKNGDYRGQQKLIPKGQGKEIPKKHTDVIKAPDGTTSNPLSKDKAKQMQKDAQNGNFKDLDWSEYSTKDLTTEILKQTGIKALEVAVMDFGLNMVQKAYNGEEINSEEVAKTAIKTVPDTVVKIAAGSALKVGAEKGIISVIPKGTPAGKLMDVACVIVEDSKIIGKMIDGELTLEEGAGKIAQTIAIIVFRFVGFGIGGAVGEFIGYMIGSKIGDVIQLMQDIKNEIKEENRRIAHFINIANEAVDEIERQCMSLKRVMEDEFKRWDNNVNNGFQQIGKGICNNDANGIATGLNTILSNYNDKCAFSSIDEFNDFFDDPNSVFVL